jgi:hypothetical protein
MPALAVGLGAGAPPGVFAGEFIEVGLELARGELPAGLDLLATFPPVRLLIVKDVLRGGVSLT